MNNYEKLLRAFIEASGFEVEEIPPTDTDEYIDWINALGGDYTTNSYKVTKQARIMMHPVKYSVFDGDLFSLGCQVANDDIRGRLKLLGFELDKNQMHAVMETIIFHIARNK